MQSRLIEAPVYEPFTLSEVKNALRVTHNLQDDLIWTLALSARKACEDAVRIAISPQRWITQARAPMRHADEFFLLADVTDPERILKRMVLQRPPITTINSVVLVHRHAGTKLPLVPVYADPINPGYFLGDYAFDPLWGSIAWTEQGMRSLTDPFYPTIEVDYTCGFPILLNPGAIPGNLPPADRDVRQVAVEDNVREAIFVTVANGYDDPDALKSTVPARAIELLRPFWNSPRMAG